MSDPLPTDLRKVDPARCWEPWEGEWSPLWAGHLLRRAAFGTTPSRLEKAIKDGMASTVKKLLAGGTDEGRDLLEEMGERFAVRGDADRLRGWWLYVMLHGGHPLREKMALLWHDHFATSVAKVRSLPLMHRQNVLIRKHALGGFRDFVREMGRDPAMLVWLDSNQNVKGKPNENYARELMELFTLGVGNYTEKDVQEAARAFTGWHTDDEQERYRFDPEQHDGGPKTILGHKGDWGGDDVVNILLTRPACGLFLAGKLWRHLVADDLPEAAILQPVAARLRKTDYDIADAVGMILRSRIFYSPHALQRKVKSPVEFVLGAVQAAWPGPIATGSLAAVMGKMGQKLYAPPNVKGWPGGKAWLSTATMLARNNFADRVAAGDEPARGSRMRGFPPDFAAIEEEARAEEEFIKSKAKDAPKAKKDFTPREPSPATDCAARFAKVDPTKPGDIADGLLAAMLPGIAPDKMRAALLAHLQEPAKTPAHRREQIREAAHAILCSAAYQLC